MDDACRCRHVENDVLKRGGLRRRPVHSRGCCASSDVGRIDDKIPHLLEEGVGRNPVQVTGVVRVSVNQTKPREAGCGFECGEVIGIANELREVVRDNGG